MKISERIIPLLVTGFFVLGIGVLVYRWIGPEDGPMEANAAIEIPELSAIGSQGKLAFDANCASCHGTNAAGTDKGPPFIHTVYNPGHHSDDAFLLAAKRGVRSHHWRFGNMPPQPQVSEQDMAKIIRYVRELQEANGIFSKPHIM